MKGGALSGAIYKEMENELSNQVPSQNLGELQTVYNDNYFSKTQRILLHTVGPNGKDKEYKNSPEKFEEDLTETLCNLFVQINLSVASEGKESKVAIPFICCGAFSLDGSDPIDLFCKCFDKALGTFLQTFTPEDAKSFAEKLVLCPANKREFDESKAAIRKLTPQEPKTSSVEELLKEGKAPTPPPRPSLANLPPVRKDNAFNSDDDSLSDDEERKTPTPPPPPRASRPAPNNDSLSGDEGRKTPPPPPRTSRPAPNSAPTNQALPNPNPRQPSLARRFLNTITSCFHRN
jgi:hypothetical protein